MSRIDYTKPSVTEWEVAYATDAACGGSVAESSGARAIFGSIEMRRTSAECVDTHVVLYSSSDDAPKRRQPLAILDRRVKDLA